GAADVLIGAISQVASGVTSVTSAISRLLGRAPRHEKSDPERQKQRLTHGATSSSRTVPGLFLFYRRKARDRGVLVGVVEGVQRGKHNSVVEVRALRVGQVEQQDPLRGRPAVPHELVFGQEAAGVDRYLPQMRI